MRALGARYNREVGCVSEAPEQGRNHSAYPLPAARNKRGVCSLVAFDNLPVARMPLFEGSIKVRLILGVETQQTCWLRLEKIQQRRTMCRAECELQSGREVK